MIPLAPEKDFRPAHFSLYTPPYYVLVSTPL